MRKICRKIMNLLHFQMLLHLFAKKIVKKLEHNHKMRIFVAEKICSGYKNGFCGILHTSVAHV